MVDIGAYEKGSNPVLDQALAVEPQLQLWLRQADGGVSRADAMQKLALLGSGIDGQQPHSQMTTGIAGYRSPQVRS
jgi:hypothetical protein